MLLSREKFRLSRVYKGKRNTTLPGEGTARRAQQQWRMAVELTSKAATWNESIVALHGATDSRSAEQALTALETALANPSLDNASCRAELAEATASAQRKEWWTAALESQASSTAAIFQSPIEADLESGPSRGGGGGGGGGEVETRDAKDICGRICQAFRDPICFIAVWLVVFSTGTEVRCFLCLLPRAP